MSAATKENVQLLRAVVRQPTLYDRSNENYRKRLPSENSWDMVASEVGESVEKCKRRWRQLRNDYTRWCNADANRRRHGQRRFAYPLAEEVRFLDRHLNLTDTSIDGERSGSEKDRDSNRDSESRDNTTASSKGDATLDDKSVNEDSLVPEDLGDEDSATKEVDTDKDKTKEKPKQKKAAQEKTFEKELDELEEPEGSPEADSYLQSDQEGDEPLEEEHLEQLEDFDFEDEEPLQEKEKELPEKTADSPASPSEFFIKQNKEPHLLIIGKKNSTFSGGEPLEATDSQLGDPLEEATMEDTVSESAAKTSRGRESTQSPSRRLRRIKEAPIKKATQAQRVTRFQRTKSMGLAAGQSMRSSTSPVKMTPVPRSVVATKSLHVKKSGSLLKDDIFPRPAVPPTAGKQGHRQSLPQSQPQREQVVYPRRGTAGGSAPGTPTTPPRRSAGRPPKKLEMVQRIIEQRSRQPSPSTSSGLTMSKPISSTVSTGTANIATKGTHPATTTNAVKVTKIVSKPPENMTVMSFSPASNNSPSSVASTSKASSSSSSSGSPSGTLVTGGATNNSVAVSAIPAVPAHLTLIKRCDRGTQTGSLDIYSDDHFLELIKPQMKEMNPRQKMHFKKKVFQALMETFDDATDFPEAGELQHFNINTPSGFEHVSNPELRLIRELVSMVSAAKVSARGQPQPAVAQPPAPPKDLSFSSVQGSEILRGTRGVNIPRQLVQRVYKSGSGLEIAGANIASVGQGAEKKMYRLLQTTTNGKPNGSISASLEDLRKDSVDSDQSVVRSANMPPASPRGSTIVASVRPQASSINSFFGQSNSVSTVKSGPSLKARALARRYSICSNGNQPNSALPLSQVPPATVSTNLSPMEAAALKRRLMAPAGTHQMVPPTQRPRYSGSAGMQQVVTPQGNSLLVRKPMGTPPGNPKQALSSPAGGDTSTPQKTPQIMNVQGSAFKDFVQPKPAATAAAAAPPASSASPASAEGSSQPLPVNRTLVVANAKGTLLAEKPANKPQQQPQPQKPRYSSMTAATIAADDFSLASLKREPVDHMDDQDDILGM